MSRPKYFEHKFLEKTEITENYDTGSRRYLLPNGLYVPSVTTVLSSLSKDHIEEWRKRVGEVEANKIMTRAKNRGTAVHALAEKYVNNEENYAVGSMPINLHDFNTNIKPFLDANVDEIYGIEYPLWSTRLMTAGRTDLITRCKGVNTIIDFKTSRNIKKEEWVKSYFLQATCYSLMLQERTGLQCPNIAIIISVDHEEPQIFEKKRTDYLEETVKLFKNYSA